jgi:aromatic ring-cleaving dioxygenase
MGDAVESSIESWHAHVYFDAGTRDAAWQFRVAITARFGAVVEMGRFHERPVGPHPLPSYQMAFKPTQLADIVSWLTLHRDGLDVFIHPNTGDALRDHRDRALWLGRSHELALSAVGG